MARHLFIAQKTISTWMDQNRIIFDGDLMTIKADDRQFRLTEAVRFVRVESEDQDEAGLIGKVKTDEQLVEMGAERYRDSVLYEDLAYKVQEGFVAEVPVNRMDEVKSKPDVRSEHRKSFSDLSSAVTAYTNGRSLSQVRTIPSMPTSFDGESDEFTAESDQPGGLVLENGEQKSLSDEELLSSFLLKFPSGNASS
jgi:hypothetical protein